MHAWGEIPSPDEHRSASGHLVFPRDDLDPLVAKPGDRNTASPNSIAALFQGWCGRCLDIKIRLSEQRQPLQALTYNVTPLSV